MAQPAEALTGIYIGVAIVPALLYAISVIPLLYFRLDADETAPAANSAGTPAVAE